MTVVPHSVCRPAANTRPSTSVAPPGGNGTMMRTCPLGYACACTEVAANRGRLKSTRREIISVVHAHEIKPLGRRNRRARRAIARSERISQTIRTPLAVADQHERADHRAHLVVQERA